MSNGNGMNRADRRRASRAPHLDEKLADATHGLPDLGTIGQVQGGHELGLTIRATLVEPEPAELPDEFVDRLAELAATLNEQYPGNAIEIRVALESYVGCKIVHWYAEARGHFWHTEQVTMVGSQPRPTEELEDWAAPERQMMQFLEWALLID